MSALEKFITEVFGEYGIPTFDIDSSFRQLEDDARAELAALRAELASHELIQAEAERFAPELARQIGEIEQERDALRATVVEQARQLDVARELIEYATHITIYPYTKEALDWLAANAPAQQGEATP